MGSAAVLQSDSTHPASASGFVDPTRAEDVRGTSSFPSEAGVCRAGFGRGNCNPSVTDVGAARIHAPTPTSAIRAASSVAVHTGCSGFIALYPFRATLRSRRGSIRDAPTHSRTPTHPLASDR
jgi:hypothetical protein